MDYFFDCWLNGSCEDIYEHVIFRLPFMPPKKKTELTESPGKNMFSYLKDAHEEFKSLWWVIATLSFGYWALFEYGKWIKATQEVPGLEFGMFASSISWVQVASNALMVSPIAGAIVIIGSPYLFPADDGNPKIVPKWQISLYSMGLVVFLLIASCALSRFGWDNFGRPVCVKDISDDKTYTWSVNCTEYAIAYQWDRNTILHWDKQFCSKWFVWELISVPSSSVVKILNRR